MPARQTGLVCILIADDYGQLAPRHEQPGCRHTPDPEGYLQWHAWAAMMLRTHRPVRCPVCGLWAVWIPKRPHLG